MPRRLSTEEIHDRIRGQWRDILLRLGIPAESLTGRQVACPACGGRDRFCFDDRRKRGDFICRQCGADDGFGLLRRVYGWEFRRVVHEVCQAAQLDSYTTAAPRPARPPPQDEPIAQPTQRVRDLLRGSTRVENVPCVMGYLQGRKVWPLPRGTRLRATPVAEYWEGKNKLGYHAALLAPVHDIRGELVTVHVTYLESGRKIEAGTSRKMLSGTQGREGCAVQLMPAGKELGIGEGIESCLAWSILTGRPAWAALNTSLLQRFVPPQSVDLLHIVADRDVPGLAAAWRLRDRLEMPMRLALPQAEDWAAELERKRGNVSAQPVGK